MAMKGGGDGELNAEINVTPLVDVMLVLLIIFMITAPMMNTGVSLELPQVTAQNVEDPEGKLVLSIAKDDKIFLGGTRVTWAELETKLKTNERVKKESALYIEADNALLYGRVVTAMAIAKTAGVTRVMMLTAPTDTLNLADLDKNARALTDVFMSMKDGELELVSGFGTAVITIGLFVPVLWFTEKAEAQRPEFGDMESIEASIAYKKTPQKQPQKKVQAAQPVDKPEGVSRDENKKVEPKKDEPKKPEPKKEDTDPLAKFKHPTDDDTPTGKPTTEPGEFNGNEFGWAPQTKGHPFWQKFAQDIHENFNLPTISDVNGIPVGCFHITPDGKIADTKIKDHSQSPDLDRAAKDAIDAVAKLRNANPTPVPTELLGAITRWICIRFDPKQAG